MLPFDRSPWAKTVASLVIAFSIIADVCLAVYFEQTVGLHISEIAILVLLLLTVIPPNAAIVLRKHGESDALLPPSTLSHPR